MGEVYAITGGKGGVGKTTTAINAGTALAQQGLCVVIVDADLGMTNLGTMLDIQHDPTIHDVLAGRASLADAVVEGPAGVDVLPGSRELEAFPEADPEALGDVLEGLRYDYDCVVVDTSVGLDTETVVPIRAADAAILVSTPDQVAIRDGRKMARLAERVDTKLLGAVVTKGDEGTTVPEVADRLDVTVLAAVPRDTQAVASEPLVVHADGTYAAQAYSTLGRKLSNYVEASVTA
jgi:septum site-determining protein MinD